MDYVQWSGPSPQDPEPEPAEWQEINYKHDVYGRRSEKEVDGFSTRYLYDGDHVIAEYDGNNNLLRKYIYGPGIDQPVCMIEVADSNAVYYYHFDALGSVVALSDSSGDTVQTYEYSVYGQVAVEDINHPNPYMFAGRRFDIEIGLYYNRARYYNPFVGRFLQVDPIGYGDGTNLYRYCSNNPIVSTDPTGTTEVSIEMDFVNNDPCNKVFYEWTGDFKVCNFGRDTVAQSGVVRGSVEVGAKTVKGVCTALGVKDVIVVGSAIAGGAAAASGPGAIVGAVVGAYAGLTSEVTNALDKIGSKINDPGTYLSAYIRVKEYRRRTGCSRLWSLFDDGWDEEWAEGSHYGWVEVTGGKGWEVLQKDTSVGYYKGVQAALDAIREAIKLIAPKGRPIN